MDPAGRPYAGESDLPLIVALIDACETAERLYGRVSLAGLRTDAANPTGATQLYESAGFRPLHTLVAYVLDLEAAGAPMP